MSAPPDELPGQTRRGVRPWRLGFSLLVVAAAAVGLLPDLLGLDHRSPFAQLVAFRPVLLGGLAVLAVGVTVAAGLRRRGWTLAAGLLAVTLVGGAMVLPRALPALDVPEPDAPPARTLTVLAFNTFEGRADVDAVAALVRSSRPDLIALPESAGRFRDRLAPLLPDYRFAVSQDRGADVQGVAAAVRADLGGPDAGEVTVQVDRSTTFPSVEVSGGGLGDLRFVAFHSVAPTPGDTPDWRADLAGLGRWCADRRVGPAIVAGDFNATLDHSVFRDGMTGCADAAERTGAGLVGTWPSRAPRWLGPQIDHVLVTGGITAETTSVHDIPGSDHRAVVTRLRLPA
jgi:endonuclease/exonuclease/phosphatase (EEP) superfamily protein YafD